MLFSVVIPAHNAESEIGAQLDALAGQLDEDSFEVIVVDNRSTDATADVAREFMNKIRLRSSPRPNAPVRPTPAIWGSSMRTEGT